ncbi:pyruvate phosphate dikinase-like enzyme [Haloactinospora alba]|uniref:Phosphoenolpyruvate synthase n=1 Tax=Haloactinospora alba TaxID=405555 RepID=A0A543NIG6_9ACTN|nr:PEP/pyruvate-binding domain-containing protein [Haloactinospora alba]TQN31631.1 pyruvate phosphate dikinase-like enzyme [Haloactinospora alba]
MREGADGVLCPLTAAGTPDPVRVGGKAAALIEMSRAGLPVPPGVVLTTAFFRPWLDRLRAGSEWRAFVATVGARDPAGEQLRECAGNLQIACERLAFTEAQQRQLSEVAEDLPGEGSTSGHGLLAVRSSAPQEDLWEASFAGIYESFLGVTPGGLAEAVREVFVSGMAFAAVSYKRQHNLDPARVEIAVVVQQQVNSASAGAAFSLNPRNNDYDQAVVHANWGLGETVVSGGATPDRFTVDKVGWRVVDRRTGAKETVLWALPGGGSVAGGDGRDPERQQCVLTDRQAVEVARMAHRVEELTTVPVDVEWTFDAEGVLYLLQARPVTTYFPLPEELRTAPDAPRRLYADSTLFEEGLQDPLSVLGARCSVHGGWRAPSSRRSCR